jgi:hypothetical protein
MPSCNSTTTRVCSTTLASPTLTLNRHKACRVWMLLKNRKELPYRLETFSQGSSYAFITVFMRIWWSNETQQVQLLSCSRHSQYCQKDTQRSTYHFPRTHSSQLRASWTYF